MKLLKDYFKLQKEIYDYFGYVEDWVILPIDDCTNYFWIIDGTEISFAEGKEMLNDVEAGNYYCNEIFHQRFLPKAIYHGVDYTMIVVDTHTDGNKLLQIFDNDKNI